MRSTTFTYTKAQGWSSIPDKTWDSENTLILIFAAPVFESAPAPILALADTFSESIVIGCSTSGEIANTTISDNSLSVMCIQFERTEIALATAEIGRSMDSRVAGAQLASELYRPGLSGIFVLSDGVNVNGSGLIEGFNGVLSNDVKVSGGLAGDGSDFEKTWVIVGNELKESYIAAVGFYGEHVRIGHGSKGGWDIFGPEREVTKSNGNVLFEIDGKPALELYKRYLGEYAAELPASGLLFPLGLKQEHEQRDLVRTVLKVDENDQSMTFAGDLPEGSMVRLMRANFDRLIDGALTAAERASIKTEGQVAVVAISCVGRRLILRGRSEEELDEVLSFFPPETTLAGFYSYGEISPYKNGFCDLHNQTMTVTTFGEE